MRIAIALILVIAYIAAAYWALGIYDEIIDEIKRGLDEDFPIGVESAHVRPVHADDGRLIGFVRERSSNN